MPTAHQSTPLPDDLADQSGAGVVVELLDTIDKTTFPAPREATRDRQPPRRKSWPE